jgi:hypothetical protein
MEDCELLELGAELLDAPPDPPPQATKLALSINALSNFMPFITLPLLSKTEGAKGFLYSFTVTANP